MFYSGNFCFLVLDVIRIASCKIKRYKNNSQQDFLPKKTLTIHILTNQNSYVNQKTISHHQQVFLENSKIVIEFIDLDFVMNKNKVPKNSN